MANLIEGNRAKWIGVNEGVVDNEDFSREKNGCEKENERDGNYHDDSEIRSVPGN